MKLMLTSVYDNGQVLFHSFNIERTDLISKSEIVQKASQVSSPTISIALTFDYTETIGHLMKNILNGVDLVSKQVFGENETDYFVTTTLNENGKQLFDPISEYDIVCILLILDRLDLKYHIIALIEYLKSERKIKRKDVIKSIDKNRLNTAKIYFH